MNRLAGKIEYIKPDNKGVRIKWGDCLLVDKNGILEQLIKRARLSALLCRQFRRAKFKGDALINEGAKIAYLDAARLVKRLLINGKIDCFGQD